ncbi:hypothetical protein FZEAL_9763 [Fusarium zealandicum]|uniref:Uncharacterized protein n=1 Tax=Fusarium zealandicum TaxID=1053134 RepID=A0A8H4U8U1_9HYPO|nr:hypothetical protein FZEAL_9763 [Fusarium zealandicum]
MALLQETRSVRQDEAECGVDNAVEKAWLHVQPTIASQIAQNIQTDEWAKNYNKIREEEGEDAYIALKHSGPSLERSNWGWMGQLSPSSTKDSHRVRPGSTKLEMQRFTRILSFGHHVI